MDKRLTPILKQILAIPDKYSQNNFRIIHSLLDSYLINFTYETMTVYQHDEYCAGLISALAKYRKLRGR